MPITSVELNPTNEFIIIETNAKKKHNKQDKRQPPLETLTYKR